MKMSERIDEITEEISELELGEPDDVLVTSAARRVLVDICNRRVVIVDMLIELSSLLKSVKVVWDVKSPEENVAAILSKGEPIMQSIYEDTARTTLREQENHELSDMGQHCAEQIVGTPEQVFGADEVAKWEKIAYANPQTQRPLTETSSKVIVERIVFSDSTEKTLREQEFAEPTFVSCSMKE